MRSPLDGKRHTVRYDRSIAYSPLTHRRQTMESYERKYFGQPDEVRQFPMGRLELVNMGDGAVGRLVLEPGWRWSEHVKPIAGTEWCEAPHFQYHVAGVLRVIGDDGSEFDAGPGEVTILPARHDAYVVGDEQVVIVDFFGAMHYAKA
jgi:hypothetical protein